MEQVRRIGDKFRNDIVLKICIHPGENIIIVYMVLQLDRDVFLVIHNATDFRLVNIQRLAVAVGQICGNDNGVKQNTTQFLYRDGFLEVFFQN